MKKLKSINPSDGSIAGETVISTKQQIEKAVGKARTAYKSWRITLVGERIKYFSELIKLLNKNKEELAELTTREMGKPLKQAQEDVEWEISFIKWYVENARSALEPQIIKETDTNIYKVVYEPWGVCASIAPWNFPVSMASSGISQQVIAGNCVIFKPSEYTTLTQKKFVELLQSTGIPDGVVQGVYGDGEVGKMLVDSDIDLVWFTGSTAVGQEIYAKAGRKFIKGLMELGGSSPAIVFADCDFERAVDQVFWARFLNCGQVCSAVKRLFVQKPIFDRFVAALKEKAETIKVGDPLEQVDMGPLVSKEQYDLLVSQVEDARNKGVNVVCGGKKPEDTSLNAGYYYLPTILTNVTKDMQVFREEVFGPVLPVIPFETETEALELANDTPYGLSAEVYTLDRVKANRVSGQLDSGMVGINTDGFYEPFAPIGGMKKSGMGREYGVDGFRELTQVKYICEYK